MTNNVVKRDDAAMKRQRGFTLLELMIVVVIISILAAMAIPAYGRYAIRTHRVDGQELLLRIANAQERFYATNNRYGTLAEVGFGAPVNSEKLNYVAHINVAQNQQSYTVTASPQNGQERDDCKGLTISNTGVKAATGSTTNGSCW